MRTLTLCVTETWLSCNCIKLFNLFALPSPRSPRASKSIGKTCCTFPHQSREQLANSSSFSRQVHKRTAGISIPYTLRFPFHIAIWTITSPCFHLIAFRWKNSHRLILFWTLTQFGLRRWLSKWNLAISVLGLEFFVFSSPRWHHTHTHTDGQSHPRIAGCLCVCVYGGETFINLIKRCFSTFYFISLLGRFYFRWMSDQRACHNRELILSVLLFYFFNTLLNLWLINNILKLVSLSDLLYNLQFIFLYTGNGPTHSFTGVGVFMIVIILLVALIEK